MCGKYIYTHVSLYTSAERISQIFGLFVCNDNIRMFKSNGIFVFLFKASHLTILAVFYYIINIQLKTLDDVEDTHNYISRVYIDNEEVLL